MKPSSPGFDNTDGLSLCTRGVVLSKHERAMEILAGVRKALADRLVDAITRNEAALLDQKSVRTNPLACDPELEVTANAFIQLGLVLEHLRGATSERAPPTAVLADQTFERFVDLVKANRLNEATQVLAAVLRMPHDRLASATKYFARHSQQEAEIRAKLAQILPHVAAGAAQKAVQLLIQVFGFQAVEAQMALRSLQQLR